MKKIGFVILLLLAALWSCEYETIVPKGVQLPDGPVSFSEQIAPIFVEANCISCHSGSTSPDLRADKSYSSLTSGGILNLSDPGSSKLIEKIESGHGTSGNLTALQKALILKWIEEGAKNN